MKVKPLCDRRQFLSGTAISALALWPTMRAADELPAGWRIAPFKYDVTPRVGDTLAGLGRRVVSVRDTLEALGYVITFPGEAPVVICAVDWLGINSAAQLAWQESLARGARTTPERVAVHCVHQHDAPRACLRSQQLVAAEKDLPPFMNIEFFNDCLKRGEEAVATAVAKAVPLTHVGSSKAKVERVAGNRRVNDENGRMVWRGSGSQNAKAIALPEGKIDPYLQTIAYYSGNRKIVAAHYYATHPMSDYGRGLVSSDFPGLARKRRQADDPGCLQVYFTGCAGDIAAGKYNDGSAQAKAGLIDRMYGAMVVSENALSRQTVSAAGWKTESVVGDVYQGLVNSALQSLVSGRAVTQADRVRPAMRLAWVERVLRGEPLQISALQINDITLLHLPGEMFVEYQLRAQQMRPDRRVMVAAYCDGSPMYIPTADEYARKGYELSVTNNSPAFDGRMMEKIALLLG